MELIKGLKLIKNICDKNDTCDNCPLYSDNNITGLNCNKFILKCPEEVEKILIKWAKEHPQKTILMDFLEKYPNAKLDDDGTPEGPCPYHLGYDDDDDCIYGDVYDSCKKCWNRPMED